MSAPYRLTKPCIDCPFRTDIRPYLRPGRVDEIRAGLVRSEFRCHKTVNYDAMPVDDEGEPDAASRDTTGEAHCAGALILLEKLGEPSQMMRVCERIGLYDRTKLDMAAPVFDSFEAMREAMVAELRKGSNATRAKRSADRAR